MFDSLILASGSPRRRDILQQLGVPFVLMPSGADETPELGWTPLQVATRVAARKTDDVSARLAGPNQLVLGADTIVVIDGRVLGKPADDAEARSMLTDLAGRTHEVITGVALRSPQGYRDDFHKITRVTFREMNAETIARYVASGEGRDKAGSYAIQGLGAGIVAAIDGCYSNVVGLSAPRTLLALQQAGMVTLWP